MFGVIFHHHYTKGVKIRGAAIQGIQVYNAVEVNLLTNNFADWESGHYGTDGGKGVFVSRIRLIDLWPIPSRQLYFNAYGLRDTFRFVLRTFNASQGFLQNVGEVPNGYISNFTVSVAYLGLSIFESGNTALNFMDYQNIFANGDLKPWISLA
jgi:hypothetical protein